MSVANSPSNKEKTTRSRAQRRGSAPTGGTSPARRQAAAILEVLAGVRRPREAAQVLGTSLPRYYQLERRALVGLLRACEPVPRGPRVDVSRQLAVLERENRRLKRECDRQQALVRMAERSLGLSPPSPAKAPAKSQEKPGQEGRTQRRPRRASVRALAVARGLHSDESTENAAVASAGVDPG